jgi:autotransporter-associated beta strand protein
MGSGASLTINGLTGSGGNNEIIGGLQGDGNIKTGNLFTVARLTIQNTADYIYSGQITGSGRLQIIKDGTGTLTLSGDNTYQGLTTINGGTIKLGSATALGSADNGTAVASGASLDLNGIVYSATEPLTIAGTGVSASGAIRNSNAVAASFPGIISLTAATTVNASNPITLSGNIVGQQSLAKTGTSTLSFASNSVTVNDLAISDGTIEGGTSTINIYGDFTNSGTFTPETSHVIMLGSSPQDLPSVPFHNLTINNATGVDLSGNSEIGGTLTMTAGILNTSVDTIDIGTTGNIIETPIAPSSFVTGIVKATRTLTTASPTNSFGGIGLSLTEANIASNVYAVTRVTGTACTGNSKESILRYFDIVPATKTGLNASMDFHYFDHEITGHTESNLDIFKSTDKAIWSSFQPTRDEANNTLSLTGITSFSSWTASDGVSSSLPITLINFNATASASSIILRWHTASETNNDYFTIERSTDGKVWKQVANIEGAGNSTVTNAYNFTDNYSSSATLYYRLLQTDFDGTKSYSPIIHVVIDVNNKQPYYDKNGDRIVFDLNANQIEDFKRLKIISPIGQTVFNTVSYQPYFDATYLTPGVYLIIAEYTDELSQTKIAVEK